MSTPTYDWQIITHDALDALIHPGRGNSRGVLFVHGFWGASLTTWKAKEAAADFCELIYDDSSLVDYDVFRFTYRTGLLAGDAVVDVARQLREQLKMQPLNKYKLVLIGHSMGGLISMRCILDFLKHGDQPNVIGLMLYGTPTNGADWVRVAKVAARFAGVKLPWVGGLLGGWLSNHKQLEALERASDFVQALNAEWALRVINGGNHEVERIAARRLLLPVKVVIGTIDRVVPEDSAKGNYGEIACLPIPYGHIELVKPENHNDRRYQQAQAFLEKCRQEKPTDVLLRLRGALDRIWETRDAKLIRDWQYEVDINVANHSITTEALRVAEFVPCEVKTCSYRMILDGASLLVGVAISQAGSDQLWRTAPTAGEPAAPGRQISTPCYVHQIMPESVPERERGALYAGLTEATKSPIPEVCWNALFPSMELSAAEGPHAPAVVFRAGDVTRGIDHFKRVFTLPPEAHRLVGREVEFSLKYQSVVPRALQRFKLMFPWLTDGCNVKITIAGKIALLPPGYSLPNQNSVSVEPAEMGDKATVSIRSGDLLLPNSSVELRWNRND